MERAVIKIVFYLSGQINRLHSYFCFSVLGNSKSLHVWPSDEWLHIGAKQKLFWSFKSHFMNTNGCFQPLSDFLCVVSL